MAQEVMGAEPEAQMEYWHALPEQRVTSNDAAFHGVLLMLAGEDPADAYAGRVAALKERGWLPAGFDEPADAAVTRGTLAYAIVKALDIRGGLTMSLFGASPRYAARELQFLGIYPASSPQQTFSGPEFVGVMGRVEDYQRNARVEELVPRRDAVLAGADALLPAQPATTQATPAQE